MACDRERPCLMHMSKRGKKTRRRRVLKVRRLKRKIRQQASKHAQDVERYQKEIQELKLRERHHDIIFHDALRHIYHPYGNERCIYYTNWDKEIADGFFSAFHELDYR